MKKWLFHKIVGYLVVNEGCNYDSDDTVDTVDSVRTIVQDSFGFRYEVSVKTLGRIYGTGFDPNDMKTGSYMTNKGALDV